MTICFFSLAATAKFTAVQDYEFKITGINAPEKKCPSTHPYTDDDKPEDSSGIICSRKKIGKKNCYKCICSSSVYKYKEADCGELIPEGKCPLNEEIYKTCTCPKSRDFYEKNELSSYSPGVFEKVTIIKCPLGTVE